MEIKDRGVRIRMNISSALFFWSGQWIREWNAMSVLSCCTGPRCRTTGGLPLLRGFHYDNACLRGGREPLLLKKLACRVPPLPLAERLPDEIKYNPTETKLICLWFFFFLFFFFALHRATFLPTSHKEPSCDTWIWTFKRSHDRLNNPRVPFPIGFLDYNMFSLFSFGYPLLKLKQPPSFFMKATFNPSLPHFFQCLQALYVALPD